MTKQPSNQSGNFNFRGKGLVALLTLVVLGGGALAFNYSQKNNARSPQSGNEINNQSQGGSAGVGDISVNPNITNNPTNTNQNQANSPNGQQIGSLSTTTKLPATDTSPSSLPNLESKNEPLKSTLETTQVWSLKYPIYQLRENKCVFRGVDSVTLFQEKGGRLSIMGSEYLNNYSASRIQGTVVSSGEMNGSLASNDGKYLVSFQSNNLTKDPTTVIKGKATMVDCPDSTFELRLN